MTEKQELQDELEAHKRAAEAESDQRSEALDMLKFVKLGEQWPDAVKSQRDKEGRPCLTINRLPAFGKQITNDARQNRPMIKCHPVGDKADRETAEIYNGLIRNIEYTSDADIAYDTALDFAVNSGIGYVTVDIEYACEDNFDKDIKIKRVDNPFAVFGDPDSTAADSSDWNRSQVIQKFTKDAFERRWPKAQSSGFDLSDVNTGWFEDDKIQVAESWKRVKVPAILIKLSTGAIMGEEEYLKIKNICDVQGITVEGTRETEKYQVSMNLITGQEILERHKWPGRYIPIVPCYGDEVNVDGKRSFQSLFHFAKDPQRNYNYHRSMVTEMGALAPKSPFIGPIGAFKSDIDKWNTANSDAHPFIGYDGNTPPQRQPFAGPPSGFIQEALAASDDMKSIMGLYDASLGARSNETSGRAILARQREGDVSTFNFIDNQSRMIRHLGRILVDLIPKVYDVPRIVRVIKEDGSNYSVPINQPVQVIQKPPVPGQSNTPEYRPMGPDGAPPAPMGMPQGLGPQAGPMQGGAMPPQMSNDQQEELAGLVKVFDLAAGKYDVTCEAGPSFTTRREEAATQMMQFIQANPNSAPLIGDLLAKSLDWPGADEIAKRLQAMLPPQAQSGAKPPQLMLAEEAINQLKGQMQQMGQSLQEKQTADQMAMQELQIKGMEAQTKRFDAETKRMAAMKPEAQDTPDDNGFEAWKLQMQDSFDRWKTEQDNAVKIAIAEMERNTTLMTTQQAIDQKVEEQVTGVVEQFMPHLAGLSQQVDGISQMLPGIEQNASMQVAEQLGPVLQQLAGLGNGVAALHAHITAPKRIIRDESGRAVGVEVGGGTVDMATNQGTQDGDESQESTKTED